MKIAVFSTVAQHQAGANIHVQNLQWALQDFDYNIFIQTFKNYKLDIPANLIEVDQNPYDFYFFWDYIDDYIRPLLSKYDYFLFTEQDIFFTDKVKAPFCPIHISLKSQYLSIFNEKKELLYPRIWEGATFISSDLLSDAFSNGVSLGSHVCYGFPEAENFFTTQTHINDNFQTVSNYVRNNHYFDTLFEFSYYCFRQEIPFQDDSNEDVNYEMGDSVVHFRAIDMMCHDAPKVYDDIYFAYKLSQDNPLFRRLLGGCALMLLLSGVHSPSCAMRNCLTVNDKGSLNWLQRKILMLHRHASEWMNSQQLNDLNWAISSTNIRMI